jgi:hypothetical protein
MPMTVPVTSIGEVPVNNTLELDPDIVRTLDVDDKVIVPMPDICLNSRALRDLDTKIGSPAPLLMPLMMTEFPERFSVSMALMFLTFKVLPLMLVPVILVAFMVVIVARGEVNELVLVIVWALMVLPVMSVTPVMLVNTAVVPVCICPPTMGENDEVRAFIVPPTMVVPEMLVPVMLEKFADVPFNPPVIVPPAVFNGT